MKEENQKKIEIFNQRLEALFEQVCQWLEEVPIEYSRKEADITLKKQEDQEYITKRLDIFDKEGKKLFSLIPYSAWVIGSEGRVELEGYSGTESLVYLSEDEPSLVFPRQKGWHWVDERIIGKNPLLTKDIFLALLERIN